tara:strand:+ start:1167 stop:1388 length:222 start_codon:yes stop_codon:yes gene_type:complete
VRQIVEVLHDQEDVQALLVTALAHGLTAEEIDELHEVLRNIKFPLHKDEINSCTCGRKKEHPSDNLCPLCLND